MTHLWHDLLDWFDRTRRRPHLVYVAAIAIIALWCIGMVWAGETVLIEGDTDPAYQHPIAAASPHVAAQVTDPTVEPPPAPVGSVATCEWRNP